MRKRIAGLSLAIVLLSLSADPVTAAYTGPCYTSENNEHDYLDAK